ncbi:3-keto-5-aminohexanoate cleavage protein [Loktanella sp. IMCC34160]|uniref:3-keto-5-aminohexanoate cleavage protein n=1 Tax=Loktanella sp. IMCC34160 TaxID=2510646 RepID=UPI0013EC255C|nr:3-keto-5-aminohexanoate cleavage protein [Loktanella sp. IMCC34160]
MAANDPLRIMVAPTGALRSKRDHAALPMTPGDIARTAADCQAVGASDLHLHVRDANGNHSLDAGLIQECMAEVAALAPGLRIQLSTDSAGYFEVTAQLRVLQRVVPEAASLNIREMARDEAIASRLYRFAEAAEITVQHILYGPEDLRLLQDWRARGIVPDSQSSILCVTGRASPFLAGRPEELGRIASALRGWGGEWMVSCHGQHELAVAVRAIGIGGHVRVGFENNLQRPDGTLAADNAEQVAAVALAAHRAGRPLFRAPTRQDAQRRAAG